MGDLNPTCDDLYAECRHILPGMSVEQTKQIEAAIKAGNFLEAASVVQTFKNLSGIEFNIAITGESGSGKSSLVNVIRGLGDEDKDEDASETGVLKNTTKPVPYWHPMCPIMIVWDLPSIGTPDFRPDTYLKQVKFSRYDVFIIIASERSRFCLTELARELTGMGKKSYFVRSKVDLDLFNEKHKKSFNEEKTLEKIRNDCVNNLSRIGMSSPQVFLVSNREFQKYDSPQLQKTLLKELYHHKPETIRATEAPSSSGMMDDSKTHWADLISKWGSKLPGLSEEEIKEFQTAAKAGNLSKAIYVVKMSDDVLRNTKLSIAITGNSGSGKSSFINAIRSLNDDDRGAAKTWVKEMTDKPTAYPHHIFPNVTMWDLPGIGTMKCPAEKYVKDMKFDQYDFFIIITAGRFTEADTKLAKEISRMGKKFYFVRTKVDVDLDNEQRKRDFSKEKTLHIIRSDCMEQLQKAGISSPQVFLVSRWHFDKYDSPELQETLANEIDTHRRHVLICALPSTSEKILKKKQKALHEQIWKQALKSCAVAAVPLPFLSVKCDVDILMENMREYCQCFGLDDDSIKSLARQVGKSVDELKSVIKCPLVKDITRDEVFKRLREATGERMMTVKYFISVVPLIGSGIAAKRSYSVTYEVLHTYLDEVAEDTQRVLKKALEGAENN
ncbi:interferon-inducible GTPase 5-like [Mauremys reevesii]|uniref:interferon-inducible GTPase 5-like n=1 Tax=Mauremys reevesii TaxID=260615 RepID=UPI00193FDEAF|nr:interferon-inducible GTPase 5-like [Mauremys reevesii]